MDKIDTLTPPLARSLIRSLNRGTAVAEGARFIHVGHNEWIAAQLEMLCEVAEDGHAETKFVRGAYGAGKSHFLSVVQDFARETGWATSHIECKSEKVEIDRFETLYPRVLEKLQTPATADATPVHAGAPPDPVRALLDKWTRGVLGKVGIREGALSRPFDADDRVYALFEKEIFRSSLPTPFVQALLAYCRASLARDNSTTSEVIGWLKGGPERLHIAAEYVTSPKKKAAPGHRVDCRPIGKATAHEAMRAILWLIRSVGYKGLVLCIDEIEELARLPNQKRQDQALQALREFVDHAGGDGGYRGLCLYLAATPEMFESDRYFPRYDALATRIQPFGNGVNWRGPVIDLDKKPLGHEQLVTMGKAICRVHQLAYEIAVPLETSQSIVTAVVDGAMASRHRLAKPRLLARMLIDELERARKEGLTYQVPADFSATAAQASASVLQGEQT